MVRVAGVTLGLVAAVNTLPAQREVRNVSHAEDNKDDGAEEVDAFPQPADDADDGAEKVDAIP